MLKNRSVLSLLKILAPATLSLVASASFAATPEDVMRRADDVQRYVYDNADRMTPMQLRNLDQALARILSGGGMPAPRPGPGPGPGPGPAPDPGPGSGPRPGPRPGQRSTCELLGRGAYANWTYGYRLALNGQVMEGSDDLGTILSKINQYRQDGACNSVLQGQLTLGARGSYANWTYNFLAKLNGTAIAGSDDLESALAVLAQIDQANAGIMTAPRVRCQLLPRGSYGNWTYNYRVGVGAEVMTGTDVYDTAVSFMQRLRSAGVCI